MSYRRRRESGGLGAPAKPLPWQDSGFRGNDEGELQHIEIAGFISGQPLSSGGFRSSPGPATLRI